MKRLFGTMGAAALLLVVAAGPASAAVERHQIETKVYDLQIGYGHTFTIGFGCNDVLSATGYQNTHNPDEDITATLSADGTYINIESEYIGGWGGQPYSWTGGFPVAGGTGTADTSDGGHYTFDVDVLSTVVTHYKNHGEYVAEMGGGADAAHSCIGMPVQAQS